MDLDNPANSRFVLRLGQEFHNCWSELPGERGGNPGRHYRDVERRSPSTVVDPSLVTSKALKLTDGIVASSGGRHEANVIALYEFKTGTGNTAFDTSGVEPVVEPDAVGQLQLGRRLGCRVHDGQGAGLDDGAAESCTT